MLATVCLGEPDLLGARPIDIDAQVGPVNALMKVHVGRPADLRDSRLDLLGELVVCGVASGDLHVDRRGQSEVQDLAHDIRRRKVEFHVRKLAAQLLP